MTRCRLPPGVADLASARRSRALRAGKACAAPATVTPLDHTALEWHARGARRMVDLALKDLRDGRPAAIRAATVILETAARDLDRGFAEHEQRAANDIRAAVRDLFANRPAAERDGFRAGLVLLLDAIDPQHSRIDSV